MRSSFLGGDIAGIVATFVLQSNNKVALRNLSMVLRQLGGDAVERAKFMHESVKKAKEALQQDVKDGTSWCESSCSYS